MRKQMRRISRSDEEADINLTPMLDVVFIMLIFFIVTATFIKLPGIEVRKPVAETGVKKPTVSLIVAISANDEIWIDKKRIDKTAIRAHIERLHAENPLGTMAIQAHGESTNDAYMAVLSSARALGLTQVAISIDE